MNKCKFCAEPCGSSWCPANQEVVMSDELKEAVASYKACWQEYCSNLKQFREKRLRIEKLNESLLKKDTARDHLLAKILEEL